MFRSLFTLSVLATLCFAQAAGARSGELCSEDEPEVQTLPAEEWIGELTEEIVPCAVLDSEHFGPHCAAARVFIHTDTGVLLCSILLPPLDLELAQTPWIDPLPQGGALSAGPSASPGAPAAATCPPAPPLEQGQTCALGPEFRAE